MNERTNERRRHLASLIAQSASSCLRILGPFEPCLVTFVIHQPRKYERTYCGTYIRSTGLVSVLYIFVLHHDNPEFLPREYHESIREYNKSLCGFRSPEASPCTVHTYIYTALVRVVRACVRAINLFLGTTRFLARSRGQAGRSDGW